MPWKRFLSLCFSECLLESVPYVKPLAAYDTASTGPFLLYIHILSFLWLRRCQTLQMEKGSQIPLLVKRRKCSRKIFPLLFCLPTAPLDSAQRTCNSKVHSLGVRAWKYTLILQPSTWEPKGRTLPWFLSSPGFPGRVPVPGQLSPPGAAPSRRGLPSPPARSAN